MTNFIYNMQDELFHLNMILPVGEFSPIKKLADHIEAQGKQLRELNAAITKRNKTIEKYECEKKDLQERNSYLIKKVQELNEGIRDSEDLTWKQKYEALLHSSEQAICALQKKCQEYKNSESDAITSTIETLSEANKKLKESNKRLMERRGELMRQCDELYMENEELKEEVKLYIGVTNTKNEEVKALAKAVRCPCGNNAEIISAKNVRIKELEEKLKNEVQANKDLNVIINSKNKLLDEYMTKCNNLEHRRNELITRANELSAENKRLEAEKKIADDRWWESERELTKEKLANKKFKEEKYNPSNYIQLELICHKYEETLSKIRDLIDGKE